ncbi:MAG: hypothetical protein ACKVZH_25295 [Blastocatellia bacterium]
MTWNDEIVDEVRRVRNEHAEKFNYDIAAICADIRQKQADSNRRVVVVGEQEVKPETLSITAANWQRQSQPAI